MSTPLNAFNLVVVGDNFPITSMSARDFQFRGREFVEKLRVGPLLQAASRNVEITALPDRFQIGVNEPDDLDILTAGVAEVLDTFLEFVGRRTVKAVGHNAQMRVDAKEYDKIVAQFVKGDLAHKALGVGGTTSASVSFQTQLGSGKTVRFSLAKDQVANADGGVLDLNFNYDIANSDSAASIGKAVRELRNSLAHAERVIEFVTGHAREMTPQ